MAIGIIGGGAMGSALLKGMLNVGLFKADEIYLVELDQLKQAALTESLGIKSTTELSELAKLCQIIILAVKPQVMPRLLIELKAVLNGQHLVISIAAGITLSYLEENLPEVRIVRVMPNTPARIGQGVSAYCLGNAANIDDVVIVNKMFNAIGKSIEVMETQMNAVIAVSGSAPAYVYSFIEALTDAGVLLGLSRETASFLVTQTILGSAALVAQSGEHPAVLRNEVTSPAGTTAAALFELEQGAFKATIIKAAKVAAERGEALSLQNKR